MKQKGKNNWLPIPCIPCKVIKQDSIELYPLKSAIFSEKRLNRQIASAIN